MLLLVTLAHGATLNVGPTQPYATIGAAVAAAARGDEVVIDPGTYVENLVVTRDLVIRGSGQGVTVIRSAGGSHVVTTDADLKLEALTIDADGDQAVRQRSSGARFIRLFDVEIHGADTLGGSSGLAGAVDAWQADLVLNGCWIHDNGSKVGAVRSYGQLRVVDSVFENNVHVGSYGAGAIYAHSTDHDSVLIRDSTFVANSSSSSGGAVELFSDTVTLPRDRLEGNVFVGNHSDGAGGALLVTADVSFSETFYVNVIDSLFVANDASIGGALAVDGTDYGYSYAYAIGAVDVRLTRSTFVDNTSSGDGAHVWVSPYDHVEALNLVLAHGTGGSGYVDNGTGTQDHLLLWSNGTDGAGSAWAPGPGTFTANPLFVAFSDDGNPDNDDLSLQPSSPAIDAGSPLLADDPDGSPSDIGQRP